MPFYPWLFYVMPFDKRPFDLRNDAIYFKDKLDEILRTKPVAELDVRESCDVASPS